MSITPLQKKIGKILGVILLVISISLASGWFGARLVLNSNNTDQQTANARRVANDESQLISTIAKDVGPSVVSINAISTVSQGTQESAGTGFIITSDGYIMTNRHVVAGGVDSVTVTLSDGTKLEGVKVVGRTQESDSLDAAFLKVDDPKGHQLTPVSLGDSDQMQVGDMVVAIGNALGEFRNSVTSGIISGYGRTVSAGGGLAGNEELQNLFQTDAAINQGNSGGPLVNSDGQVIGINTAVADAENIGFAIPINDALGIIKGITSQGQLLRPYLGVRYIQLDAEKAKDLGIDQTEGAYISKDSAEGPGVIPNSPAAEAGLKSGDIITQVDAVAVTETKPLTSVIGRYAVGDVATITFLRDGQQQTVQVTIQAMPQ